MKKIKLEAKVFMMALLLAKKALLEEGINIPKELLDNEDGVIENNFSVYYERQQEFDGRNVRTWWEVYVCTYECGEPFVDYTYELAQAHTLEQGKRVYTKYRKGGVKLQELRALFVLWKELNNLYFGADLREIYAQLGQDTVKYFAELVIHNRLIHENEGKLSQLKWKITLGEYNGISMLQDLPKELWYLPLAWQEVYEICKAHDFYVEAYDQEVIKETFKSPLCVLDLEEVVELTKNCWLYNTEIEMEFEEEDEFEAKEEFYDCDDEF